MLKFLLDGKDEVSLGYQESCNLVVVFDTTKDNRIKKELTLIGNRAVTFNFVIPAFPKFVAANAIKRKESKSSIQVDLPVYKTDIELYGEVFTNVEVVLYTDIDSIFYNKLGGRYWQAIESEGIDDDNTYDAYNNFEKYGAGALYIITGDLYESNNKYVLNASVNGENKCLTQDTNVGIALPLSALSEFGFRQQDKAVKGKVRITDSSGKPIKDKDGNFIYEEKILANEKIWIYKSSITSTRIAKEVTNETRQECKSSGDLTLPDLDIRIKLDD